MAGNTMSRRSFVASVGALGGAAAVAQLATPQAKADESSEQWDEEYDVVIVGAGAAGLCAALTVATEYEGSTCLILEKADSEYGAGNSPVCSGSVLYCEDGEAFFEYLKELRGDYTETPDDVLKTFADEMVNNLPWIMQLGATEDDLKIGELGKPGEYPELEHSTSCTSFSFTSDSEWGHIYRFLAAMKENYPEAITEKTSAPAKELLRDETGRVIGVTYTEGDTDRRVKANKGVIMCCGGFESSSRMRQDFLSAPLAHPVAGTGNTGDGHLMCAKVGADFWHMHSAAGFWTNGIALDGSSYVGYRKLKKEAGITVGTNGRRFFMDWDMTTSGWPNTSPEDVETPSQLVGSRHGHQQFGGEWELPPTPAVSWFVYDADGAANGAYNFGSGDPVADGYAYSADTIEELAELMEVPVDELVRTVDLWNSYVENGVDLSFFRPADKLVPVAKAPFYAMKQCCELLNTDGGPVRSAKGEILDLDGNPIPGLFSAGEFGSVWCNKYQGAGNLGECLAFGRIAARSAMNSAE